MNWHEKVSHFALRLSSQYMMKKFCHFVFNRNESTSILSSYKIISGLKWNGENIVIYMQNRIELELNAYTWAECTSTFDRTISSFMTSLRSLSSASNIYIMFALVTVRFVYSLREKNKDAEFNECVASKANAHYYSL